MNVKFRQMVVSFTLGVAVFLSPLSCLSAKPAEAISTVFQPPCQVFAAFSGSSPDGSCGQMTIYVVCDAFSLNCTVEACDNGNVTATCTNY